MKLNGESRQYPVPTARRFQLETLESMLVNILGGIVIVSTKRTDLELPHQT
jgi:hypothetical protein